MAKQHSKNESNKQPSSPAQEATSTPNPEGETLGESVGETIETAEVVEGVVAGATPVDIVTTDPNGQAPQVADDSDKSLVERYGKGLPPAKVRYLAQLRTVDSDEITRAMKKVAPEKYDNFMDALDRMNPIKQGVHTSRGEMQIPDIKMYHGSGADPLRPGDCPVGGIYTSDGRVLAVPKAALKATQVSHPNVGTTIDFTVLLIVKGNTFFLPQEGPQPVLPDWVEVRGGKAPICRSLDRERGDTFGPCGTCTFRPFQKDKEEKGCRADYTLYVVLPDFTGIYRLNVHGSSTTPCAVFIDKKVNSSGFKFPWAKYFTVEAMYKEDGNRKWYEFTASDSEREAPTKEESAALHKLSLKIDTEMVFPMLHRIYNADQKRADRIAQTKTETANLGGMAGLAGLAAGAGAPVAGPPPSAPSRPASGGSDISGGGL